jgi:inositol-1,4,5-trisphosphate 5-phosphatase
MRPVRDRLTEFPLNFPPTYPFEENVEEGSSYMKTRCLS